jgi:chaperone BCS1
MLLILGSMTTACYWLYNQGRTSNQKLTSFSTFFSQITVNSTITASDWFWRAFLVTITGWSDESFASLCLLSSILAVLLRFAVRKPDRPHDWLCAWLTKNRHRLISASHLTLSTKDANDMHGFNRYRMQQQGDAQPEANRKDLKLMPGEGLHVFNYNGKWVWLTRTIGQPVQNGFFGKPIITETITVSCLGTSTKTIEDLFMDAWNLCNEEEKGGTKVYALEDGYDWRLALTRPPRPVESVVLDGNIATMVIDDLKNFFKSQDWYQDRGIPYRRGVLLHGPPGCGKTSFITAVVRRKLLRFVAFVSIRIRDSSLCRLVSSR